MGFEIQHAHLHFENRQVELLFDERDAQGNILRHGRLQFTVTEATRDALLAEASAAIVAQAVKAEPANLGALIAIANQAEAAAAAAQTAAEVARQEAEAAKAEKDAARAELEAIKAQKRAIDSVE